MNKPAAFIVVENGQIDKYSQQPFEIYTVRECISWIRKVEKAHGIGGEE